MKLQELFLAEGALDDFRKYRGLGQQPHKLAGHVAGKIYDKVTGNSSTPGTPTSNKQSAPEIKNKKELKIIVDKVLRGEKLEAREIEILNQFKKQL